MRRSKTASMRDRLGTIRDLEERRTSEATAISLGFIIADAVIVVAEILECILGEINPKDTPFYAEALSRAVADGWRGTEKD